MAETRLRIAGLLLGAFSVLASVLAAPVALNVGLQPDSASAIPGGDLVVTVLDGGAPLDGVNVTATAADGSWDTACTTDAVGTCALDLPGTKGRAAFTVANETRGRDFFLPEDNTARWTEDLADEDDPAPLGYGPADALPAGLVAVAGLFGLAAGIALYRRTGLRLALFGVGATLLAHLFVFQPFGLAISAYAGYALVKDARYFGAVHLDEVDLDEEE